MPLYEYRCESDGASLTLLRPMREADAPVDDPEGLGRVFERVQSTFMTAADLGRSGDVTLPTAPGGMCGCGRPPGSCGAG